MNGYFTIVLLSYLRMKELQCESKSLCISLYRMVCTSVKRYFTEVQLTMCIVLIWLQSCMTKATKSHINLADHNGLCCYVFHAYQAGALLTLTACDLLTGAAVGTGVRAALE